MSIPLHHFVAGGVCGVVPVKPYCIVAANACESGRNAWAYSCDCGAVSPGGVVAAALASNSMTVACAVYMPACYRA